VQEHFEVIGQDDDDDDGYDVEGDVMGDVMGYAGPMGDYQVVGYDEGGAPIVLGANPRRKKPRRIAVRKPGWRKTTLAPGVIAPDQGLVPLPMGNTTFALANQIFTFQGQVQKPFAPERILLSTVRTGATAIGRLLGLIFVGTDLAQVDIQRVDLEQLGDPNAFGVRMRMKPMQPGVFLRIDTTLSNAIAGADTIFATMQVLGRYIG
jgi:hypothetical protein